MDGGALLHTHKYYVFPVQVTLLAALKVLGISAGLALSRGRERRDVSENLVNIKKHEKFNNNDL